LLSHCTLGLQPLATALAVGVGFDYTHERHDELSPGTMSLSCVHRQTVVKCLIIGLALNRVTTETSDDFHRGSQQLRSMQFVFAL
jgi:hypothetical protein